MRVIFRILVSTAVVLTTLSTLAFAQEYSTRWNDIERIE